MWEMGRKAEEWRLYMDERMKTQQIKERKGLNEKLDRMHEYNKREIELRINDLKEERRKELERIGRRREQEREGRGEERSWATEARRGEGRRGMMEGTDGMAETKKRGVGDGVV